MTAIRSRLIVSGKLGLQGAPGDGGSVTLRSALMLSHVNQQAIRTEIWIKNWSLHNNENIFAQVLKREYQST